ncbi:hypothetical protein AB0P45_30350 [Streptomyces niveus]|uniref:hypothetical protein n=1 Tax=Streptomyces niveus TaxID=193462 RepID=UPI003439D6B3
MPAERRDQMLSEHGAARLQVNGPPTKSVAIMRVLRTELGIDLKNAKAVLHCVLDGDYSGTLPEMEHLAARFGTPASLLPLLALKASDRGLRDVRLGLVPFFW